MNTDHPALDDLDDEPMIHSGSDESYSLTPLGLLGTDVCDQIILYLVKAQVNGIVLDRGQLNFVNLEKSA